MSIVFYIDRIIVVFLVIRLRKINIKCGRVYGNFMRMGKNKIKYYY